MKRVLVLLALPAALLVIGIAALIAFGPNQSTLGGYFIF